MNTKAWEITVTAEMKRKMARPWQTSDILKLMGKQFGYHALQSRLASIWGPTGNMQFIDIGYGFYIMKFEALMLCLEVLRERRVEGSRGKESRGKWLTSTLFGCF